MAVFAATDVSVTINGVDLSNKVQSVDLSYSAAELDTTAMGSSTHTHIAGLKDWSVSITFFQDYAASSVDATLFSLVGAAPFTVTAKGTSSSTGATNPNFSGSCILSSYGALNGQVGNVSMVQAQFRGAGTLSRLTS